MRALFLILVLANIAFYAWSRHFSGPEAAVDPAPLGRQIEPEKLKILGPGEAAARAAKRPATPAPGSAASPAPIACLEWGSFTLADAPRAEAALAPLALGTRLSKRETEEMAGWWVFIPPQGNRQAAAKKASELKSLGVNDYFIVQDESRHRWSLSLGVFRNEQAAQARLAVLRRQGVRSAEAAPRETVVPKVWLQMRDVDLALQASVRQIASQVEGSELQSCR
jgi:hypothetical protein